MKQGWHPDELVQHWTLSREERALLGNKAGATRLGFAVLLKAFQFEGRFPERREEVVTQIVFHLANQTGVPLETYFEEEWSERTQRHQRAQIREYCGFQLFHAEDEPTFIAWLKERVASFNSEAEAFKIAAYSHLRTLCLEPLPPERMRRLLRLAVAQREEQMVAEATARWCFRYFLIGPVSDLP
jgi:hypothetical protein